MSQLLDYHVGVLRGYLLALNAPQQVLHAAEMLLDGYRSRAGEKIGFAEPPPAQPVIRDEAAPPAEPDDRKRIRWTDEEDETLRSIKRAGGGAVEMRKQTGRELTSIYARINLLKRESRWVETASP